MLVVLASVVPPLLRASASIRAAGMPGIVGLALQRLIIHIFPDSQIFVLSSKEVCVCLNTAISLGKPSDHIKPMKQIFLLSILFLALPSVLFSQDKADSPKPTSAPSGKLQIGLSFSPNVSFRKLTAEESFRKLKESRDEYEIPTFGFTSGIQFLYSFHPKWSLQVGATFTKAGYQSKYETVRVNQPEPGTPLKMKYRFEYHYLDLPVKLNYTIGRNNLKFFGSAGFCTHYFLNENYISTVVYADRTTESIQPTTDTYRKLYGSILVSAGVDWQLHPQFNVRLEPIFRYGVNSINETPVRGYLWSAGLDCSVFYRF